MATSHTSLKTLGKFYVGSVFLGHCDAKDLLNHHHSFNMSVPLKVGRTAPMFVPSFFLHSILNHFFQFVKKLNLNTDLLLAIGIDGPNINKSFEKK